MRLCLDLMVGQEEVFCDPVPWLTILMVLLVPLCPEIIVVKLPNQIVNILTGVGHGLFPLVLKILLIGKLIMVMPQFAKQQKLQTISIDGPPSARICLETLVQLLHAIDNGSQSNLRKSQELEIAHYND